MNSRRGLTVQSDSLIMDKEEQNKENLHSNTNVRKRSDSPLIPIQNMVYSLRNRLEKQEGTPTQTPMRAANVRENNPPNVQLPDNISPGLARLRNTPASKGLKFKRKVLEEKHQESRNKSDTLNVGGGVCLWPGMENMRLTHQQMVYLILFNILLVPVTIWVFYQVHGELVFDLLEYTRRLQQFSLTQRIRVRGAVNEFNADILVWHENLSSIMTGIHERFDVTLSNTSGCYKACVLVYVLGIGTLLFFLIDNVLAHNKLSPRRIQSWVSLLTVIGLWTLLSLKLLVLAQRLEQSVQDTVYNLNSYLAELVYASHDLAVYERLLLYWRTCCLPSSGGRGVLTVMGLVAVQDVMYYLQYYSVPVLTALLTPVIKLVVSLKEIYVPQGKT